MTFIIAKVKFHEVNFSILLFSIPAGYAFHIQSTCCSRWWPSDLAKHVEFLDWPCLIIERTNFSNFLMILHLSVSQKLTIKLAVRNNRNETIVDREVSAFLY